MVVDVDGKRLLENFCNNFIIYNNYLYERIKQFIFRILIIISTLYTSTARRNLPDRKAKQNQLLLKNFQL